MRPRWQRSALACALAAVLCGWCAVARAQAAQRVVVLEPAAPTALERELLTRLTGELGAAGIEVLRVPLPADTDPAAAVATQGSEHGAVAAYATREEAADTAEKALRLWLSDRVTGALLTEDGRDGDASALASALAVQGYELLRAREVEWAWRRAAPPPPEQDAAPPPPPAAAPPRIEAQLAAGMHVGLLFDAPTGKSALTPLARLSYEPAFARELGAFDLGVRLSSAGLGAPTVVQASGERIDVVQSFVLLEATVTLDAGQWLHPYATGGAGAYHVQVNGVNGGALVARTEDTTSAIAAAGLGLEVQPWRHWLGQVEAQQLFALRPTAVAAGGARAATFGRPLLVFSCGLGVTW